jgi:hypothetical protein
MGAGRGFEGAIGIMEDDQVRQHLQGSIRDPTRRYSFLEGRILQLQK